jgi:hypothetical protein
MSIETAGGHSAMDYAEHNRTYHGFIRASQIFAVHVVIILVLMAIFLL